ncbi:MAG: hypothetical protein AAF847_20465 [Bacteroidota bacterium]
MGLEQANILLEKINVLQKSVLADGIISEIERDLMKSYIRNLYDFYVNYKEADTPKQRAERPKPVSFETEVIRKKAVPPTPVKETYKPPRVIEIPAEMKVEMPKRPPVTPPPPPPIKREEPVYQKPIIQKTVVTPTTEQPNVSKEIKALFRTKKAKELSEKLSTTPIQDLTKAISLNDKLLYSNELFGGALVTFNEVTRTLNDMPSVVNAENYLMELAKQHNWTAENRQDIAKAFIKLVRRRFA